MTDNPAPRRDGGPPEAGPVRFVEVSQVLLAEVRRLSSWRDKLLAQLADDDANLAAVERDALQRAAAVLDRRVEVFAAAWRTIWHISTDRGLRAHLIEVARVEAAPDVSASSADNGDNGE